MNTILFIISILFFLFSVIIMYKFFGIYGLYTYIGFATILSSIQVCKSIELFGLATTTGMVLYASTFLCTDILSENHGKTAATKAVWIGVFTNILWVCGTQLTLWFEPSSIDFIQPSLNTVFGMVPRISCASLFSYIISQRFDVFLYHFLWKQTGNGPKKLWLRNNVSTMLSQFVDTVLFVIIAFLGTLPNKIVMQMVLTTYLFKIIVALCDTPFIYIVRNIHLYTWKGEQECQDTKKTSNN